MGQLVSQWLVTQVAPNPNDAGGHGESGCDGPLPRRRTDADASGPLSRNARENYT